jgi:hypothetical protein
MGSARVYGVGGFGVFLLVTAFFQQSVVLFLLALAALAFAAYNFPLIETDRTRIGANQYGIFVEGLGLIDWRDIEDIKLVSIAVRTMMTHELMIKLDQPIPRSLLADWRKMPWPRLMMHLPWRMAHDNVVRIPLDAMGPAPEEIERNFKRMWRFYRSSGHLPRRGGSAKRDAE